MGYSAFDINNSTDCCSAEVQFRPDIWLIGGQGIISWIMGLHIDMRLQLGKLLWRRTDVESGIRQETWKCII